METLYVGLTEQVKQFAYGKSITGSIEDRVNAIIKNNEFNIFTNKVISIDENRNKYIIKGKTYTEEIQASKIINDIEYVFSALKDETGNWIAGTWWKEQEIKDYYEPLEALDKFIKETISTPPPKEMDIDL